MNLFDDNVEWTYNLTVLLERPNSLHFTVLGSTRDQAIASAIALVTTNGFVVKQQRF